MGCVRHLLTLAIAALMSTASGTVQVSWTTDEFADNSFNQRTYGPDGPWQAVLSLVGSANVSVPVWPHWTSVSLISSGAKGDYSINGSSTAVIAGVNASEEAQWWPEPWVNQSADGTVVFDKVQVIGKTSLISYTQNATLLASYDYSWALPDGTNYTSPVGILGLGTTNNFEFVQSTWPSILSKLKKKGDIVSTSFGLHMGSAALGQPGSLVLGGYEQNRALGQVGVFSLLSPAASSKVFLIDVILGVEIGESPFNTSTVSVYQGLGNQQDAILLAQQLGASPNAAVVIPDPSLPYIYLPLGSCEAAASYLPVSWNNKIGLYTWNTADPQYSRIVSSPAYLAFVLSDQTATNITIKVPFALLNLTLESPIVPSPVPYFPCRPLNNPSAGFWSLGRAFLQATFLAYNYEQNVSFIAQAPGPNVGQSIITEIQPSNTNIATNSISLFEQSWSSSWTTIQPSPTTVAMDTGLSAGAKAGIGVGVAVAVLVALAIAFLYWRRMMRRGTSQSRVASATVRENEASNAQATPKPGNAPPREMEVPPHFNHEAPSENRLYELPISQELCELSISREL